MYICICNAIKENEVRDSIKDGAHTVSKVFKAHDCKPNCGQCKGCIRDIIEDEINTRELPLAAE